MPRRRKPTIRAIWLGQELRKIRDEAGFTSKEVGAHIGREASSIIRIEAGEMPVPTEKLDAWLEMCGITDPHRRADFFTIRKDVAQTGWWEGYRGDVAAQLMDRAWMESKALTIRTVELTYIPGLLQTPAYAAALARSWHPDAPEALIETWIDMRMTRQQVLHKHEPLTFHAIIAEHLFRADAGGAGVMRAQFNHLLGASERSNVEIRVLPESVATGLGGSFEVFDLVDPYPEVAYSPIPTGEILLEDEPVELLSRAYDRILDAALDPAASRELIIAERDNL